MESAYFESGDAQGGFSTHVDTGVIVVKAWGFWPKDVAASFGAAVGNACRAAPGIGKLTLDMTRLKPMRDEGQESFARLMRSLKELGISEVVIATSSHLTKLQLLRITREKAPEHLVSFVEGSEYA